jgi:hypothetical protein
MDNMLGQGLEAHQQLQLQQGSTAHAPQPGPLASVGPALQLQLPPDAESVLFVCLHELGRQVAVSCEDRGRLLFRVRR